MTPTIRRDNLPDCSPPSDRKTAGEPTSGERHGVPSRPQREKTAIEPWFDLLSSLSDAELARYGDIARDQKQLERLGFRLQVAALLGSFALLGAVAAELYAGWSWIIIVVTAILAGAFANFPWQKHRVRTFWQRHIDAVVSEQARRAAKGRPDRTPDEG